MKQLAAIALLLALALPARAEAPQHPPGRVVSINLCADILAADLAAPGTLKSVFRLGRDPGDSPVAHLLQDIPPNDGRLEDILPFAPDLVLAHEWSSPFTLDLIRRIGVPVATVKDARSFADIRANIRTVAAALGRKERGEAVIAEFDAAMEAARREGDGPTAILYQDLGSAVTPNSILGRILAHTGFRNVVTAENAVGLVYPGIEDVIALRPELFALGIYRPDAPSQANALLEHPALRLYRERYASEVDLPARDWTCSTRFVAGIAARLAAAHDTMMAEREHSASETSSLAKNKGVIPAKAETLSTSRVRFAADVQARSDQ
ncbi:ABC transporter substrate-binding protein [Parvibaculum sp.]|uniref:ABC transporter substrate-binding protein n=1 Tax=Parvibaculum sp. TaxID=2024848 RepID=UPI001B1419F6|nr:ABC transporter substrate-binding protein [Parvibaculum sp.]MBO6633344.1 ABC transporter substrate-binding protein [Parvibaculum sp.]MBO6678182.1 ABC transporter substrate-binding protein [Parvibaculum sp.]MBO6683671.1 ABC transporter substrate-binding protein [Parvibaculum sp.]MBO6905280.1 ABC transporter substrate-binding protein [Parvibaculum sp.]